MCGCLVGLPYSQSYGIKEVAMKWWLISDDDVTTIRAALEACTHEANSYNCEDWPPGSGCAGCRGDKEREGAVHTLDSGLHQTDAVPSDLGTEEGGNG